MTPITATAREQVKTLLCILRAPKLTAQRRQAAEAAMAVWIERARVAGAPSLGAWMDGPTAPQTRSLDGHLRRQGLSEAEVQAHAAACVSR